MDWERDVDEQSRKRFEAHEALKMELRLRGSSLAAIGRQVGVSRTTMSLVGLRKLSVPKVEGAIADALGVPVTDLFEPIEKEGAKMKT